MKVIVGVVVLITIMAVVGCEQGHDTITIDPATYEYNEAFALMENVAAAPTLAIQQVADRFLLAGEVDAVWTNDEGSDLIYTTLVFDVDMGEVVPENDWETAMTLFITDFDDPNSPLRSLTPGDIAQVVFSVRGFTVESEVDKWGNTSDLNIRCDFIDLLESE